MDITLLRPRIKTIGPDPFPGGRRRENYIFRSIRSCFKEISPNRDIFVLIVTYVTYSLGLNNIKNNAPSLFLFPVSASSALLQMSIAFAYGLRNHVCNECPAGFEPLQMTSQEVVYVI